MVIMIYHHIAGLLNRYSFADLGRRLISLIERTVTEISQSGKCKMNKINYIQRVRGQNKPVAASAEVTTLYL